MFTSSLVQEMGSTDTLISNDWRRRLTRLSGWRRYFRSVTAQWLTVFIGFRIRKVEKSESSAWIPYIRHGRLMHGFQVESYHLMV
jgi:hypothetical protein